ncbi:hypothetical protein CONLIGDRAFT_637800 [Coniochaeta ligniaria NRRL 30616]|uniref:Uncharacterized protein n=1 Tax=Coniochaeta ligniaria NRRL 30616 TaxID=1408157 RepID=A0A1J7IPU8_9PEZI|nr:hypothetical protein CONLIGDRAFT_637800 [Coniochaeta ligniaria NRRL 30616]
MSSSLLSKLKLILPTDAALLQPTSTLIELRRRRVEASQINTPSPGHPGHLKPTTTTCHNRHLCLPPSTRTSQPPNSNVTPAQTIPPPPPRRPGSLLRGTPPHHGPGQQVARGVGEGRSGGGIYKGYGCCDG